MRTITRERYELEATDPETGADLVPCCGCREPYSVENLTAVRVPYLGRRLAAWSCSDTCTAVATARYAEATNADVAHLRSSPLVPPLVG